MTRPPSGQGLARGELVLLYEQYRQRVFRYCLLRLRDAELAAEAHQEVFLKMARSGQSFRDIRDKEAWLFEVARNCCLDLLRRGKTQSNLKAGLKDSFASEPPLAHDEPLHELRDQLRRLWSHPRVDETDRVLMKLLCESESAGEAAKVLGMSPQAVNQRRRRLARLAAELEADHEDGAPYVH